MAKSRIQSEPNNVGKWLAEARRKKGLTQKELALRSGIFQSRISSIEKGAVLPTFPQLLRLSHALVVPLQWFLNGSVVPGTEVHQIALQLQWLGIVDLSVPNAEVPGAFHPTEYVLVLGVSGDQPDPRIIEAIPAALAWNPWSPTRLREYSRPRESRASIRLAWLSDIALTIHRTTGFPGGCPQRENLEKFITPLSRANMSLTPDDLGRPGDGQTTPPVSKRWMINYGAPLAAFAERAERLHLLRDRRRLKPDQTRRSYE